MLDRCKLIKEMHAVSDKLFVDFTHEKNIAQQVWSKISQDPTFKYRVKSVNTQWIIPEWQGELGDAFDVARNRDVYIALSVDGSQIYPDRHAGTACYLINVGYVGLRYGLPGKAVYLNSEPRVFAEVDMVDMGESPTELVNCQRQDFELQAGYKLCNAYKNKIVGVQSGPEYAQNNGYAVQKTVNNSVSGGEQAGVQTPPLVFLFDGSIIFWHLESKSQEVKRHFLGHYLHMMHKFYEDKTLMAGYISLTKSKELVNLIRVALCNFEVENCEEYKVVDRVVDAMIAKFYLNPYQRTTIFKNNSSIVQYYPEHLKPHFFYMHIGTEIVRIEIPQWMAQDVEKVDLVANIIADQCIKGMGYPVALAEAHEQAVVKGPDREFFYHLINKASLERNRSIKISQKSRKKLGMGI